MRSSVSSVARLASTVVPLLIAAACAGAPPPPPPAPPPPMAAAAPSAAPSAPPKVFGLTEAQFRPVLEDMDGEIKSCHVLEYGGKETDGGRIVLDWIIDSSGKVTAVNVAESSFENDTFESCVVEAARKLNFPKAYGGTEVRKPFSLRRSEPPRPASENSAPASP